LFDTTDKLLIVAFFVVVCLAAFIALYSDDR
jgi:hypothetical protein